ncbi:hypothetical protein E4U55_007194 [Claviceps digitariae]|nr:hypothetical protein E4U55_007194 [Claviceps digitariae]
MDIEPPTQYPPRIVIHDTDNDTESSFQDSDDSTIAESDPPEKSPRRRPAYVDEGELPLYQEDDSAQDAKTRRAIKKTLCIRLMASIFVAILVSVTVAAAVARIYDSETNPDQSSNQTIGVNSSDNTHTTSFTIYSSSNKSTSTVVGVAATSQTLQSWKTTGLEGIMAKQSTVTSYEANTRATSGVESARVVDCASPGLFAHASLVTDTMPTTPGAPQSNCRRCKRQQQSSVVGKADEDDEKMIGMSIYALGGCLLTRYACKSPGAPSDIVFKCTVVCPGKKLETNQARRAVAGEWGACG